MAGRRRRAGQGDHGDGTGQPDRRTGVERLLYAGEEVLVRVGRGPDEVVVTSHRLLAFTPEREGPNFHAVDRPNVESVAFESTGRTGLVTTGAKALVAGIVTVAAGVLVDFDGLIESIPSTGTGSVATGGILGMLDAIRTVLALADVVLFGLGGLLVLGGVAALVGYWSTRREVVVVAVAGGDDVHLDGDGFGDSELSTIEMALDRR